MAYPHVTQFETREREARARAELDRAKRPGTGAWWLITSLFPRARSARPGSHENAKLAGGEALRTQGTAGR